jgi:hypothetical protein
LHFDSLKVHHSSGPNKPRLLFGVIFSHATNPSSFKKIHPRGANRAKPDRSRLIFSPYINHNSEVSSWAKRLGAPARRRGAMG